MTDRATRSSWQSFDVSEVDAGIVAAAFARSPEDGAKALTVICSKHYRSGRLLEIERCSGDMLAIAEAAKEKAATRAAADRAEARLETIVKDSLERMRLAKMQANDPRREEGP